MYSINLEKTTGVLSMETEARHANTGHNMDEVVPISFTAASTGTLWKRSTAITFIAILLLTLTGNILNSQSITDYNFSGSNGTFTPITGTIVSLSDLDEGFANGIPLDFSFTYCGSTFTTVSVSSNGWMTFGQDISDAAYDNNLKSGGTRPLLAPLWDDLSMDAATDFSYETTGIAGNRIFTAQWLNMHWDFSSSGAVISFQVKLYEASGRIEFIYQQEPTDVVSGSASIGIAATGTGDYNFISLDGTGGSPSASFSNETSTLSTKPGEGQVYAFSLPPAITLSSPSQVADGNAEQGATNVYLSVFQANVTNADAELNSLDFTSAGTATASDIVNFKLYYNTSNVFPGGTPLSTITTSTGAGTHTFSSLSQVINSGTTGYFWITCDVNASATPDRTINIAANPSLSFASGTPTGTIAVGGTKTIITVPITLSSPSQTVNGNAAQGATNVYLSVFQAYVPNVSAVLNSLDFTSAGTAIAYDIVNFKLYFNTSNTFPGGTPLSTITTSTGAGSHTFSSLTQTINGGTTGYFWITCDVSSSALPDRTINIAANPTLSFTSGTPAGNITAGGIKTIVGPSIAISSTNPAVTAGNIVQNTINNVIYRFDIAVTVADATFSGLTITTTGTYIATDLSNLQVWYSTDPTFSAITAKSLSKKVSSLGPGTQAFLLKWLKQVISKNTTGYIFITADVPCAATAGATIAVDAVTTGNVTFLFGTKSGATYAGGTQTIQYSTPLNVTNISASAADASSLLTWTIPTACYDEIMIVAKASSSVTGVPTGDGSAFTASLSFGSGTSFDGGNVVYKGTASPQTVTGLTNGTLYYYKFFTRKGTNWSSGIETSATPVLPSTGDYRSAASGNWGTVATWQYYDGSSWITPSSTPSSSSGKITVRNGHAVTIAADVSADQLTVDAGGTVSVNSSRTFTIADGTDAVDCNVNGTLTNAGTVTASGVLSFNSGSVYRHTMNGGSIPAATWNTTSTCNITGVTSTAPTGLNQTFGNFTWNCTGQTSNLSLGGPSTTTGTFSLTASGGSYYISPSVDVTYSNYVQTGSTYYLLSDIRTVNVTNFSMSSGTFTMSNSAATGTLKVSGNFTQTAGTITETSTGSGSVIFNGTDLQTCTPGGTISNTINFIINTGASLQIAAGSPITPASVTIDGTLTINPLARATVPVLTNNGTLNLNSTSSSSMFSLIMNTYSGSGIANVQLFLTGGGSPNYNWHYVAVPQNGLSSTYFTSVDPYNLLAYDDSRVVTRDFDGWSWQDGSSAYPPVLGGGAFTSLLYGHGYNFYHSSDATVELTGLTSLGTTLGTAGIVSLQYSGSSSGSTIYGYNLLGNSLTCSLDWDKVAFNGSVDQAIYYTTHNQWASYVKGAGGTNGGTKDIPPLQGFFVKANATGGSIDLSNAKEHSAQARYKKSLGPDELAMEEVTMYSKVKLELSSSTTSDETIVWFNNEATTGRDASFDAYKLFSSEAALGQLYSTLEGNNYAINGIPLPYDNQVVPLSIKIPQTGSYSLLKKELVPVDGFNILLIDKGNSDFTVDLKNTDSYVFSSDAGTFTDRFILKFTNLSTGVEETKNLTKDFNIYASNGMVNIELMNSLLSDSKGEVKIFDLSGRMIKYVTNVEWHEGSLFQTPFNEKQGLYMIEVKSGVTRQVGKIFIH